ncbi:06a9cec4-e7d6-4ce4-9caa-03dafd1d43cd [Sclerotinia trifoliorum]|uniref:06a9cec4-e7d6-4ce4-9caa-03dafd1d43cd n=1 Tax=Sclerotinia trifoliorum TaxID=28548 RepID=A0A8H2W3Z4_9HELO|nr:06a9cec4-e7d6-4ce4-9caa-03dafd1d43cd [Sclerotinia trifoliorum]
MDQTAPPPYSERDAFSNPNTTTRTLFTTDADNASRLPRRIRSDTSSNEGSLIYTPPYSPTEPDPRRSDNHFEYHSAHNYFESRKIPQLFSASSTTQHTIYISPRSTPSDVPIPPSASDNGITQQDWSTFLNYLLPDHTLNANNHVANRKLKAKLVDERMQRLTLNEGDRPRLDINEVQAQLSPPRRPNTSSDTDWAEGVDEVIKLWNEGFFVPRGLKIVRIDVEHPELHERWTRMPGFWRPDEEDLSHFPESNRRRGGISRRHSPCNGQPQTPTIGSMVANDGEFKIRRNGLVPDSNGLRVGNMFIADDDGLRIDGNRGLKVNEHGASISGHSSGRRRRGGLHAQGAEQGSAHEPEGRHGKRRRGRTDLHTHESDRGRAHKPGEWHSGRSGRRRRDHSSSSYSSSSSSFSSDSDASVGSLPDYDHLKDQQLVAARDTIITWLNHSEHPMTRQTVRKMKQDIKFAKKNPEGKPSSHEDLASLRREVKDLLKKFKDVKKSQKTFRKIMRKEQRRLEKAHKKERKNMGKAKRKAVKRDKNLKGEEFPAEFPALIPMPHHLGFPELSKVRLSPLSNMPSPSFYTRSFESHNSSFTSLHETLHFLPSLHPQAQVPTQDQLHNPQISARLTSFLSQTASVIHSQASSLLARARAKEVEARTLKNSSDIDGNNVYASQNRSNREKRQEVERLLEEAEELRMEGERLRAEAVQMDEEFAREIQEREFGRRRG